MFNLVPSNRQEFLLQVLIAYINDDYTNGALGIFEPSIVMVESQGMKHYVNMGIARQCQVSMNIEFPLITRGIYELCRQILGDDKVPKESPYKREVMVWRIEQLLRSQAFSNHKEAEFANEYWQKALDPNKARFMLAHSTADVFEQYMQFRPYWFDSWQQGSSVFKEDNSVARLLEPWQKRLWQFLVNEDDWYPAKILQHATNEFEVGKFDLPKVIYIFVVNAFTEEQLKFLVTISQQVDIYLFHLNPCVEYWGDLVSEKTLIKQKLKKKLKSELDSFANQESLNTLLSNLGTQGRTLFNQLKNIDYLDYTDNHLFEHPINDNTSQDATLLRAIQQDLITAQQGHSLPLQLDNSVSVHDCHSHLREIQVLHDFLLHIINEDENIQPHDIIVLCPAVEEYAPYVKGVFRGPYDEDVQDDPKLVCSIADRAPLDADPTVAMFMDMLALPDSRFSVSTIIDYLQIESVQNTFSLNQDDVEVCEKWIASANIYWGKDASHKSSVLGVEKCEQTYTWEWGLERLLKSALYSTEEKANLPFGMLESVEGLSMHTLGKLVLFIDTLQTIYSESQKHRTMGDWLNYMRTDIVLNLFESNKNSRSVDAILKALEQINSNLLKADYNEIVSLSVAREALKQILSKPDPLNQFNTGQVTFCSMVPMRSVPFKVICILGLNDGVFPRISQPLSIDLLALDKLKVTDRSRRNEDRYMFLEAIISARDYLYLSYQGRSIKNNSSREPSLVLREFCDYIKRLFELDVHNTHPLQPFSVRAFNKNNLKHELYSKRPSFSSPYLKIANSECKAIPPMRAEFELPDAITVSSLSQFFKNPLASFAEHHLQLRFDNFIEVQSDVEPFVIDSLTKYQLNVSMLKDLAESEQVTFRDCLAQAQKSGDIPQHEINMQTYNRFYDTLKQNLDTSEYQAKHVIQEFKAEVEIDDGAIFLAGSMPVLSVDKKSSHYFLAEIVSPKLLFEFCINHAVKCLSLQESVSSTVAYINIKDYLKALVKYFAGETDTQPIARLNTFQLSASNFPLDRAKTFLNAVLQAYKNGMQFPLVLNVDLGAALDAKLEKLSIDVAEGVLMSSYMASDTETVESLTEQLLKQINQLYIIDEYTGLFFNDVLSMDNVRVVELAKLYCDYLPLGWSQIK